MAVRDDSFNFHIMVVMLFGCAILESPSNDISITIAESAIQSAFDIYNPMILMRPPT